MKKLFSFLIIFLLLVGTSYALRANKWTTLYDSNGQEITAYTTGSSTVVYTNAIDIRDAATDKAALIITENVTGGGDVDIATQYSLDGTNFYDPYLTAAGTWYAEGLLAETVAATTIYLEHNLHSAPYVRYKITPAKASKITVKQSFQYER